MAQASKSLLKIGDAVYRPITNVRGCYQYGYVTKHPKNDSLIVQARTQLRIG